MPDDMPRDRLDIEAQQDISKTRQEQIPQDIQTLWMKTRLLYSEAKNSQERYYRLLDCLDLGIAMLPDSESKLREEAELLISQARQYPHTRNIEYENTRGYPVYRITGDEIGVINVAPQDIEKGQLEAMNQNCDRILPVIKKIETRVMGVLVKKDILPAKKYAPEDLAVEMFHKKLLRTKDETGAQDEELPDTDVDRDDTERISDDFPDENEQIGDQEENNESDTQNGG